MLRWQLILGVATDEFFKAAKLAEVTVPGMLPYPTERSLHCRAPPKHKKVGDVLPLAIVSDPELVTMFQASSVLNFCPVSDELV